MRERRHEYELLFIISPLRATEEEITTTIDRLSQTIVNLGGEVIDFTHTAPWGRRKFAYPIREYAEGEASRRIFTEGYYVLSHFKLPTTKVAEFERPLKLADSILRYMLTLVDARGQQAIVVSANSAQDEDIDNEGDEDDEG